MKINNLIKPFIIPILIGFLVFPTTVLGGTFIKSLIEGKSPQEAIEILADQFDALIGSVQTLEVKQSQQEQTNIQTIEGINDLNEIINSQKNIIDKQQNLLNQLQANQSDQEKQLKCQELAKRTPQTGNIRYMNNNIVKFYEDLLVEKQSYTSDSEAIAAGKKFPYNDEYMQEAKKMYDEYLSECGK